MSIETYFEQFRGDEPEPRSPALAYYAFVDDFDDLDDIPDDEDSEETVDLEADFREAWHDAMTGNTRPFDEVLAEVRRELAEHADELSQDPDVCPRCGSWPGACFCYFESEAEE